MSGIPDNIKLQIGLDGISQLKFHPLQNKLIVGTIKGRVRIYDCNQKQPAELFRKKWHKNISNLDISKSGLKVITSSSEGSIREHDFDTGKETWCNLTAHDKDISSIIFQNENLLISGDDVGIIKFWDTRQKDAISELNVCAIDEENEEDSVPMSHYGNYLSSINDLLVDDNGRRLFAAMDDGTLVTINLKKRAVEVRSETLGYSAKSIVSLKNQTKLGVATDEGVVTIFNWNQFGNLSDRFPVTKGDIQIEKMIKINENVVIAATNTGIIKAVSLMPNLVLADIGTHEFSDDGDTCGDCMVVSANHDRSIIASGCPESNRVCFFSSGIAVEEFGIELRDRMENKRKANRSVLKERKKRRFNEDDGFLDGICEPSHIESNDDESDSEDGSDESSEEE